MTTLSATNQQRSPTGDRNTYDAPPPLGVHAYVTCLYGIVWREVLRYMHQRERFLSALVRPLIWLFIFAAGFRQALGVQNTPPYDGAVLYEVYVLPGLIGMILLFNAMQSSLSMVYDRETGAMRTLLVSPFPRWFLLVSKLVGGVAVAAIQVYVFLIIFYFWEADLGSTGYALLLGPLGALAVLAIVNAFGKLFSQRTMAGALVAALLATAAMMLAVVFAWGLPAPSMNYLAVLPAVLIAGFMLGSLALLLSSVVRQLENFAGVMNFVIFPMFFASSALYPLARIEQSSPVLYHICLLNPFTHAVELIRFALYARIDWISLGIVLLCTAIFLGGAIYAYNPSKGLIARRGGPG
ncbi:ABC transporter permease protein [Hyphomicrobium sulfonivorans]|uniref:Transport permease protein n=1 Tax=Hyphomicrobium sulfonivorans TaxID=121290 RepID=A0A109BIK7_HYPSL|nr:ABC transporter permease [Hyphomicrobium sulfonivorans]KWT69476.1 ABC transporter permease protein [Hyphomicrobium sulfonivorans]